jgi:hypothetical protein
MQTTTPDWALHIDQALSAMDTVVAAFGAAGFGNTPFGIKASDSIDDLAPGSALFSARKPDLDSAHHTLLWERTYAQAYETLNTEAGPLLHGLRTALPVLTGPMGSVELQYRPGKKDRPARVAVYLNGIAPDGTDIREALADFARQVGHLRPTTGERILVDGYAHPMLGGSAEEDDVFRNAVGLPSIL